MPTYLYRVRDKSGRVIQGQIEAIDAKTLRRKLDEKDFFIIEYGEKKPARPQVLALDVFAAFRKVSIKELSIFSWQLFTMLDAGLTLISSLRILANQSRNERMRSVLEGVSQRIEQGASFHEALSDHPDVFPPLYIHMVNAGEVGGVLDEMLHRVASYYETQAAIRSKVRAAMTYPIILLLASLGVIVFLVTVVLPQFAAVFEDVGVVLPPVTKGMLGMSVVAKTYWPFFLVLPMVFFLLLSFLSRMGRVRYQIDRIKLDLPLIGPFVKMTIVARFAQTLSTLINSGIQIMTALDVVTDTVGNSVLSQSLREAAVAIGEGKPIAQPLEASGLFPEMVVNMIRVGEETGSLAMMLDKIADYYNREIDNTIATFTKMVEPVLMVLMAGIIGYIAMSIFLPLAELMRDVHAF